MKTNLAKMSDSNRAHKYKKILPNKKNYLIANTVQKNQEILINELVYSEDPLIQKPLIPWVNELMCSMREIMMQTNKEKYAIDIANIYYQAIQIFMFIDDIKSARELCYTQIQLFIMWSYKSKNQKLLKYIFQPWIQLSQLDSRDGLFGDAMEKLDRLSRGMFHIFSDHNKYLNKLSCNSFRMDDKLKLVITKACMVEPIKIYLTQKKYHELIDFVTCRTNAELQVNDIMVKEAMAIALANTGRINEASQLLAEAKSSSNQKCIFILRDCEMKLSLTQASYEFDFLYEQSLRSLNAADIHIHQIRFGLYAVKLMKKAGWIDHAIKLAYFCLHGAQEIKDDLLKTESLIMLYELITNVYGKNIVENLIIEHYFNTQYITLRKRMLNIFDELKFVENQCEDGVITSLFEELLMTADRIFSRAI